jgi:CubicO group peptidase (beta-lactamase class C family)
VLAAQRPHWEPGRYHGYHGQSLGWYESQLLRRVDPQRRTIGRYFADEVAGPLGIEFYIGLPAEIPDERLARLKVFTPWRALRALPSTPHEMVTRILWPWSLLRKSMRFAAVEPNDRHWLEVEVPAGNGVGTARAMARAYSALAEGGAELGLTPATLAALTAPPEFHHPMDEVMGVPAYYSLGYLRPGPELGFGTSRRAFGTPGAGGSFAFADPDARLGYAYVMNKMDFYLFDDPREKPLRDAVHRSIARLAG